MNMNKFVKDNLVGIITLSAIIISFIIYASIRIGQYKQTGLFSDFLIYIYVFIVFIIILVIDRMRVIFSKQMRKAYLNEQKRKNK